MEVIPVEFRDSIPSEAEKDENEEINRIGAKSNVTT